MELEPAPVRQTRCSRVLRFDQNVPVPIDNRYATPGTLGAGPAGAAAAGCMRPSIPDGDILIVDFGRQAITIDVVTRTRRISSAATLPSGAAIPASGRCTALFHRHHCRSAQLPQQENPTELLGDAAVGAIESGVVNGIVYEIEGYIRDLQQQLRATCGSFSPAETAISLPND